MIQEEVEKYDRICEESYMGAKKTPVVRNSDWLDSPWTGFFEGKDPMKAPSTGVEESMLRHIAEKFSEEPPEEGFTIHPGNV